MPELNSFDKNLFMEFGKLDLKELEPKIDDIFVSE